MLTIERIREVVSRLGKEYGIKSAYLFGSYAKNTTREGSDVDILIDRGKIRGYLKLNGFRLDLARELGTDVDIITTGAADQQFLNKIKPHRILLYGA